MPDVLGCQVAPLDFYRRRVSMDKMRYHLYGAIIRIKPRDLAETGALARVRSRHTATRSMAREPI